MAYTRNGHGGGTGRTRVERIKKWRVIAGPELGLYRRTLRLGGWVPIESSGGRGPISGTRWPKRKVGIFHSQNSRESQSTAHLSKPVLVVFLITP